MIRRAPGLKLVVQTLLYSLKPIGNTVLIAAIFFVMFGILGVQVTVLRSPNAAVVITLLGPNITEYQLRFKMLLLILDDSRYVKTSYHCDIDNTASV